MSTNPKPAYRRVLLKLSGEALQGSEGFGIDPAVASGPLITTLNDLTAVVTYYGLAYLLIPLAAHP